MPISLPVLEREGGKKKEKTVVAVVGGGGVCVVSLAIYGMSR